MIKVSINGKEIKTKPGKTVLDVANEQGIKIPTLCNDEELKPFGSCWVCAVQVKGRRGFVTACGTEIYDGMEIITDSEDIFRARKMALELLLSDHFADCEAPCKTACPDNVDVQSYVALIANNQPHEAVKVIKDTLPMPLSIGRVCPAFCEKECRRTLVEDPIAIRQLKRYAADEDLNDYWSYVPEKESAKGKKIAVIGAGPSGLTCGYYLSNKGFDVTVYEASPEPGGWLRYGIPEYRLPKEILRKEIDLMCSNGMKIETQQQLGKDFTLSQLSEDFDAVYLALGAQNAVPMRVKGGDLPGSYLGVDFLKDYMMGEEIKLGKKVAVVGGGNTAIDCARTAKRLGSDVTIIYRRTRKEMPAEAYEVDAAEEEGVKFYMLTNPVEYKGDDTGIREVVLEKMKLGDPDSSGRRRPEPTGEFFTEEFDAVIAAISQIPEVALFADEANKIDGKVLPLSRWSTAEVDENLLYTGLTNIFAGGDFRLGPATAIEAIADGRKAAENIALFLEKGYCSETLLEKKQFCSVKAKKLSELDELLYSVYPKEERIKMPELESLPRSSSFDEVEVGFENKQALKEADRCLECGCMVNYRCDLRDQATEYGVDNSLFFGDQNHHPIDDSHPFILRDANKCIKCGRCVRVCSEIQGAGVLGYIYRGFTTIVAPEFEGSLTDTACESCGKCITVCPVGALTEKNETMKRYPLEDTSFIHNCGLCGTGCRIEVHISSGKVSYITPPEEQDFNKRNLCFYGRFGWQIFNNSQRVTQPMLKSADGKWEPISYQEAASKIKEKKDSYKDLTVSVSPYQTNEEILMLQEIANNNSTRIKSLTFNSLFTDDLFSRFANNADYNDLEETENIVVIGPISHTLRTLTRHWQRKGKKLAIYSKEDSKFNSFADVLSQEDDLMSLLQQVKDTRTFKSSTDQESLTLNEKTLFIYNRNELTEKEIYALWDAAQEICTFDIGSGVLETSYWRNLQGFRKVAPENVIPDKGFFLFYGEPVNPANSNHISKKESFIVSVDTHIDPDSVANLILPAPSYLEINGSSISDDGKIRQFTNPLQSDYFDQILHLFKDAGLLSEMQVEPSIWSNKAEAITGESDKQQLTGKELSRFLAAVKPQHEKVLKPNTTYWHFMKELEKSLHN